MNPEPRARRLAVYGSLAPGGPNHGQLSGMKGTWRPGTVRGRLLAPGKWARGFPFPGLVLDPAGDDVPVQVFESAQLPRHWQRLDRFEGRRYRRVMTEVATNDGPVEASVYIIRA